MDRLIAVKEKAEPLVTEHLLPDSGMPVDLALKKRSKIAARRIETVLFLGTASPQKNPSFIVLCGAIYRD
ncbi:MAG: hypothetical protein ACYC37_07650 [Desulfobacteria bacterium]